MSHRKFIPEWSVIETTNREILLRLYLPLKLSIADFFTPHFQEQAQREEAIREAALSKLAGVADWQKIFLQLTPVDSIHAQVKTKRISESFGVKMSTRIVSLPYDLTLSKNGLSCKNPSLNTYPEEVMNCFALVAAVADELTTWTSQFKEDVSAICAISPSWRACLQNEDAGPGSRALKAIPIKAYKQAPRITFDPMSETLARAIKAAAMLPPSKEQD